MKQDEKRLTLETEIAKSKAREDALASVDPNRRLVVPEPKGVESKPGSVVLNQTTSEMRSRVPVQSLPVARGFPTHNPEAPEWQHRPSVRIETLFTHGIISLKSGLLKSRAY